MKNIGTLLISVLLALIVFSAHAGKVININTADAKSISKTLKGVGIKKAEAIIVYRKKHGAFKTIQDVAKVKGIGTKTIQANKDKMMVGAIKKGGSKKL